jgi:glycerophosphoryl diester phosphodiesterase
LLILTQRANNSPSRNDPYLWEPLSQKRIALFLPKVIGHRGICAYAPENTLASLEKAAELGIAWIEFDVMLTQDGEAIVFHDETLNRTTNGKGLIAETTLAEIATLEAGAWFSPAFSGEKVPTFVSYLKKAAALNLGINVEIKPTAGTDADTAKKVVELLRQYWPNTAPSPLISSFSVAALTAARALDKNFQLGLLLDSWLDDWQKICAELQCVSLHMDHTLLSIEKVQQLKRWVNYVLAYTVNNSARAEQLFAMGVDAVFSDGLLLNYS